MSHINFQTPLYFQSKTVLPDFPEPLSSATTSSDVENNIPQSLRPSSAQASTIGRKVLGTLNLNDRPDLTSLCSSPEVDYADTCASTRAIISLTQSPKWQLQFALLHRNRPLQGLDSALRSSESLCSTPADFLTRHSTLPIAPEVSQERYPLHESTRMSVQQHPRSHWFHRFNIFQKFRKPKDNLYKAEEQNDLHSEVLTCYNEFKTKDFDQRLKELKYLSHFESVKSLQWGYLDEDSEIPPFAPLHELNDQQLKKLKQDLLDFSELDSSSEDHDIALIMAPYDTSTCRSCSDSDISLDGDGIKHEQAQDQEVREEEIRIQQLHDVTNHIPEVGMSAIPTAPASALLPKSIQDSTVSSPSFATDHIPYSGSIQSSRELILEHTRSKKFMESNFPSGFSPLRILSAFEQVDSLHSLDRDVAVQKYLPDHGGHEEDQAEFQDTYDDYDEDENEDHREQEQEEQQFEDPEHQPLPGSSIYSPVVSGTQCTSGNSFGTPQCCFGVLDSDTAHTSRSIVPVYDSTEYAATHRYRLLSGCVADSSAMKVGDSLVSTERDFPMSGIALPDPLPRIQGISTCPPKVDLDSPALFQGPDFPIRMNSLLKKLKCMRISNDTDEFPEDTAVNGV